MCARLCSSGTRAMVVILVFGGTLLAATPYGGGTGEPNDPYLIYTAEQMNAIGANPGDWCSHFKLMADLDLSGFTVRQFHLIGPSFHYRFAGVFDGNGHTISNFTYTAGSGDYVGLFGYVDDAYGAEIKNLGLINPRVTGNGGSQIGSLVGHLRGTITNCYARGGSVSGRATVGGLVGESYCGTILNCYSTSAVQGTGNAVGGLVGSYTSGRFDLIANCYATGAVSGKEYVGGLVGLNGGLLLACYSTGKVTGNASLGGLVGWGTGSAIGAFWDTQTSGRATSFGGAGRTSDQMRDPGIFRAAGWDFFGATDGPSDIWTVDSETGYPILWWQVPAGALPSLPAFAGGTGTAQDPYRIASAQQLNSIGHNPRLMTAHFKLVNNISLAGVAFWMIGDEQFPFAGDFDGAGRTISNLAYRYDRADLVGLFGCVTGTVRNLTLVNPKVEIGTGYDVGALAAIVRGGTVRNCRVQGARISGTGGVGGLVGHNDGTIRDCVVNAVVRGESAVGGLAGPTMGTIANCEVTGTVTGEWSGVGGVAGTCASTIANCCADCTVTGGTYETGGVAGFVQGGVLINCYVRGGSVSGDSQVGGLVGFLNTGDVWNCYSTCAVAGETKVGGLIGSSIGTVSASFWNIETSGQTASAGGVGKTSAGMKDPETFLHAGWDFFGPVNGPSDIWTFDSDAQRPVLWWQVPPEQWPELPHFAGGTGTPEDPYRIASALQLSSIGHNPRLMECSFKLMVDLDLKDMTFYPIGGLAAPFSATFDGDNHTISHLTCVRADGSHVGLLGHVEGDAPQIRNVRLSSPQVSAGTYPFGECAGALVGYVQGAMLLNCRVEGGSVSGWHDVGGLAGSVAHSSIRNCAAATAVTGDHTTGGLIGHGLRSTITACQATGRVTAGEGDTGGLLGTADSVIIRDSFATGSVTGAGGTGGLVGWAIYGAVTGCHATGAVSGGIFTGGLLGESDSIVTDCRATGKVSGTDSVGGLIGSSLGAVGDCYATGTVTGDSSIGGLVGDNGMGPIDRSHTDGAVTGKKGDVGGLVGRNDGSAAITDCGAVGAVTGQSNVGGLIGYNTDGGEIAGCRASGTVLGQTNTGGLAGFNDDHGRITDCYASGGVSGQEDVGGLVGRNGKRIDSDTVPAGIPSELPGVITNCYSSGRVSGVTKAGGLVGFHHCGSITGCFWDMQTSGQAASAGGASKPTADLWSARTFLGAGWDLVGETEEGNEHVWWIREGQDYPRLWWERDPDQP